MMIQAVETVDIWVYKIQLFAGNFCPQANNKGKRVYYVKLKLSIKSTTF